MAKLATTRMSSKGQVVIPEDVRESLGLKAGAQFVVVGKGDVVILKSIEAPTMSAFDDIIGEARRQARIAGLKRTDIAKALKEVRARR